MHGEGRIHIMNLIASLTYLLYGWKQYCFVVKVSNNKFFYSHIRSSKSINTVSFFLFLPHPLVVHMDVCKLFYLLTFHHIHLLFIVFTVLFQDVLDLRYSDYREKLREQEVAGKEQAKGTQVETNLPDSR